MDVKRERLPLAFEISPATQLNLIIYLEHQLQNSFGRFMAAYHVLKMIGIKPVIQDIDGSEHVINIIKATKGKQDHVQL